MKILQRVAVIAILFAPAAIGAAPAQAQSEPRHYDCSKAGNADKQVCKAAAAANPASDSSDAAKTRHYDCTKPGNADKEVCKAAAANSAPAAETKPAASGGNHAAATHGSRENDDPDGAIAQCKDGKYSHAAHRDGACADHGGVAKWLRN